MATSTGTSSRFDLPANKHDSGNQPGTMALVGKHALITGAGGAIGSAIAGTLFRHGASLILTGRNLLSLQQVAAAIRLQENIESCSSSTCPVPTIDCIPCDVSQEDSVESLFEEIESLSKRVDILINNAGINVHGATVDLSAFDFDRVMKVNVLGPFMCSKEAIKRMIRDKRTGSIINIGSLSAKAPRPHSCPYTASKFALEGLTRSLALDGRKHGIKVGIVHPGNVRSTLLTEEMLHEREQGEGFIEPQDVGDCILSMLTLSSSAVVLEMTVLPSRQPFVGRG